MTELELALRRGARRTRKLSRLGGGAQCAVCGEADWRCLDLHEPSGRVAGKIRVAVSIVLCRNCHAKASEQQYDHPRQSPSAAQFMRGVADLLQLAAERIERDPPSE